MASELVVGYSSNSSDHVDVDDDLSSCCNVVHGAQSSPLSMSSHSGSALRVGDNSYSYCQYADSEDMHLRSAYHVVLTLS
jgi:hypothetical protein